MLAGVEFAVDLTDVFMKGSHWLGCRAGGLKNSIYELVR
jgi:hypothetical protein